MDAQGAIESSVDLDHAAALDAAYQGCDADFLAAHPRPLMNEAAWTKLYKHQLFLVGCLRDHGFPPVHKTPAQADYVAAGRTLAGPAFYAWSAGARTLHGSGCHGSMGCQYGQLARGDG